MRFFIIILCAIILTGCSSVYRPYSAVVPGFDTTTVTRLHMGAGGGGNQVQIDQRFSKNFSLFVGGIYDKSEARVMDTLLFEVKDNTKAYQFYFAEGGLTFNTLIGQKLNAGISLSAGYGYLVSSSNAWSKNLVPIQTNIRTYSAQPFVGIKEKSLELYFVPKLNYLWFVHLTNDQNTVLKGFKPDLYLEPQIIGLLGSNKLKFGFSAGYSIPLSKNGIYDNQSIILGASVVINVSDLTDSFEDVDDAFYE